MYKEITPLDFKKKYIENFNNLEIIDVREENEFNQIKIKGSKLISMGQLWNKLNEIDWTKEVIFICRTWWRSWYVTNILNSQGYESKNLAWWIDILRLNCEECMNKWDLDKNYFH